MTTMRRATINELMSTLQMHEEFPYWYLPEKTSTKHLVLYINTRSIDESGKKVLSLTKEDLVWSSSKVVTKWQKVGQDFLT